MVAACKGYAAPRELGILMETFLARWQCIHTPMTKTTIMLMMTLCFMLMASPFVRAESMAGIVVAWGWNEDGQTNVPAGLSNVTAIASSSFNTVALRNDGTAVAWGDNYYGQTNIPVGLSNMTAIASGYGLTVALQSNGTVLAWGYNQYGQRNIPAGLSNVIAIAAGYYHTVALKSNGTVEVWGANWADQTNIPSGLSNVTAIAANYVHTVALKSDGTLAAWGHNYYGDTTVPTGLSGVRAIAAGMYHTVALQSNGTVVAWGYNYYGQTNVPAGLSNVVAIAAGGYHTVALKNNGTVVTWGDNWAGQMSVPTGLSGVTAIAASGNHTVALMTMELPNIATQPASTTVNVTSNVDLSVSATGTEPFFYQWMKDAVDMNDATNATLSFIASNRSLSGNYSVRISNFASSVTSSNAVLRVLVPQQMDLPSLLGDGRVQLAFRDAIGSGLPDDLTKLVLISTDELRGDNTVWTTNTSGFTTNNGYLLIEDLNATNVVQRFYRVMEW